MKNPADRLALVGEMLENSVGAKILAGGFSYGDYDIAVIIEADSNTTAAAIAIAIASVGAVKSAKTTPLLSGDEWIESLQQASSVTYTPSK